MLQEDDTVYLLDGSAYVHRAYHAIRGLSNSKGFPTNAVFGFTRMLLKLLTERTPVYLGVVFDTEAPTVRHRIYPEYKATRPAMPEDLAAQIPIIRSVIDHLNIKTIEKPGYEADDVMGTLAKRFEAEGFRVILVSGDKDFRQVISPNIAMWDSMKDHLLEYGYLKESHGIEPEQFIDVMGLSGDVSDNIPGVPRIGEKIALELIRDYGSLEEVYANLEHVGRKDIRKNLTAFREQAFLSRRLVTIEVSVPLEEGLEDLRLGPPKKDKLADLFRDMEFKELWEQFSPRVEGDVDYRLCRSGDDLKAVAEEIRQKGLVSVDTETTSPDPFKAKLVGISLSCEEGRAHYLPLDHSGLDVSNQLSWSQAAGVLKNILEDAEIAKVGQNIKYDAQVFRRHGVELRGLHFDTMIASYLINPGLRQHNLDNLAAHYLGYKMLGYKEVTGKGKNAVPFSAVDPETAKIYACEDADITLRLKNLLESRLRENENLDLFYGLEMKLVPVLIDMEMNGVLIDRGVLKEMSERLAGRLDEIRQELFEEVGMEFNLNSPRQLGYVLFEKLQLPGGRRNPRNKNFSTDVRVLEKLCAFPHRAPRLVLEYRMLSKLKSTYVDALVQMVDPDTGRLRTSFNQTVTATGRLSSSNPNLQNIPIRREEGRKIRKAFLADEGSYLISADYSQVELRVLAHYSDDPVFIDAFERDEDIHARTASELNGISTAAVTPDMRRIAKAINFGIIYGMGARKLSDEQGIDLETARAYISSYFQRYTGIETYQKSMIETARKRGYVTTLLNRRRYLPNIRHSNHRLRAEAERMAINSPIQGTAADLIKMAMIRVHDRLARERLRSKMLLQVHDELILESPAGEVDPIMQLVKEEMEGVYPLKVPLKVELHKGRNWEEAH